MASQGGFSGLHGTAMAKLITPSADGPSLYRQGRFLPRLRQMQHATWSV